MATVGPLQIDSIYSGWTSGLRRPIDVTSLGVRWVALEASNETTELWYSTNGGTTWNQDTTGGTLPIRHAWLYVDVDNYAHVVGMASSEVRYYRGVPNGATTSWSWESYVSPQNASTSDYPAVVAHREGTGWKAHIVWSRYWTTDTGYYEYRCQCVTTSCSYPESLGCCDVPANCPTGSHGHTTYTPWSTSQWNCVCGGDCNWWQNGYHSHSGCTCTHIHRCASASQQSQWISTGSDTDNRVYYARYSIDSGGGKALDTTTIISSDYGISAHTKPTIDFHHTGDGKSIKTSTPHLFVSWVTGNTNGLRFKKATYSGGTWGWGSEQTILSGETITYLASVFDGDRYVMAGEKDATPYMYVYERDVGDTATTPRTPQAMAGTPTGVTLSISAGQDIYLLGLSGADPYQAIYTRATNTWGSWTQIEAVTAGNEMLGARRVKGAGTDVGSIDIIYEDTDTLRYYSTRLNSPPTAPSWVITSGIAYDVAASLGLDWDFEDPDLPSDTQGAYSMRRRIGSASAEYWNGSTWQASEDGSSKISTATTILTLASTWGSDGDANHYYAVKTWDAADTGPSAWSAELTVIPSAKDNPTVDAISTIGTATYTVTWTVATQTKYQVKVYGDTGGSPDYGDVQYDSGVIVSGTKSHLTPFPTNNIDIHVGVTTWNDEGLQSTEDTEAANVLYEGPPASVVTLSTFTVVEEDGFLSPPAGIEVGIFNPNPNLLSRNESTLVDSAAGWTNFSGCTIARIAELDSSSGYALEQTATGASGGARTAVLLTGLSAGVDYTVRAYNEPVNDPENSYIVVHWYTAADAYIDQDNTTIKSNAGGVVHSGTFTAPANTAKAYIFLYFNNATTGHKFLWWDIDMFVDDTTTAHRAGFGGILCDTTDVYRRIVGTTDSIRVGANLGFSSSFLDWAVASDVNYQYLVRAFTNANGSSTDSEWTT